MIVFLLFLSTFKFHFYIPGGFFLLPPMVQIPVPAKASSFKSLQVDALNGTYGNQANLD
jgi:hypothetical protein